MYGMSRNIILEGGPFDGGSMCVPSGMRSIGLSHDLPVDIVPCAGHLVHIYELSEYQEAVPVFIYKHVTTFGEYSA